MIDQPVSTAFSEFPVSSLGIKTVAVPVITGGRTFGDNTSVAISTLTHNAKIYFTTDGTVPTKDSTLYTSPLTVERTMTINAVAIGADGAASFPVEAVLKKLPNE